MNGITDEDKDLVLESILLNLLIDVLERDQRVLEGSKLKIKEPYISWSDHIIKRVLRDRKAVSQRLFKNGIKVFSPEKINEDFVEYKYLVRGYENSMRFLKHALRNYTRDKLTHYFLREGEGEHGQSQ